MFGFNEDENNVCMQPASKGPYESCSSDLQCQDGLICEMDHIAIDLHF